MKTKKLFSERKNFSFCKVAIVLSLLVFNGALLNAQVTVGSNTPPNATLDVVASNPSSTTVAEGVIAPRLTGDQIKDKDGAYDAAQNGAIVYATAKVSGTPAGKTINITAPGYYYYDAPNSVWVAFKAVAAATTLKITAVQTASYVAGADDDVILLDWITTGHTVTLPGEAEGTPIGKIIHISNIGNGAGSIPAGATDVRVTGLRTIDRRSEYAFRYIGNNLWISMTGY